MTMRSPKAWTAAIVTAVALCFTTPVSAEMPNDQQALAGLSEVKVAFDLTTGDPKQLLTQLTVIDETRESVMSQCCAPRLAETPFSGRDPQEGDDDDDRDNRTDWGRSGPGRAPVAQTQARCGATPVAG